MNQEDVSHILEEIASLLEVGGENPFKVRAFRNAARVVSGLEGDLREAVKTGSIRSLKGIGETLSTVITDLVLTGRSVFYDDLKRSVSPGLLELLKIPGLGPKRARVLHEHLRVSSVGELEYACIENRLVGIPGFGAKSQEKILEGIRALDRYRGQFRLDFALHEAEGLVSALKETPNLSRIAVAGSLRRRKEIVKDIDLVAASSTPLPVMDAFTSLPNVEMVTAKGETKSSVVLRSGIAADLRVVSEEDFPYALHHFTGSKEHNTALRGRAKTNGFKLNEYGLFRGDERLACRTEEDLFRALGLAFIPEELREDGGEIEAAGSNTLPTLVRESDIQGIFHNHTIDSDGSATAEAMVRKAQALGYTYIGISDHSQSAFYANGLKQERVEKQQAELEQLKHQIPGIRIFKGIESDILPDGLLDYPPEVLRTFDFVIASVHSRFQMDEVRMTRRMIRAIENPYTTILGHPTGRLLLARAPYTVDLDAIFDAAAACGVAVEINANPHRLDLDWRICRRAKEKGVRFCINPDAHSLDGFGHMPFGVGVARKGWLTIGDIINCMTAESMTAHLAARRKRAGVDGRPVKK